MLIPDEHKSRFIYHFTSIENLPSILEHGLLSYNEKRRLGIEHLSIAEDSIQARRANMIVTCGPKGCVHDYVPFYFGSLSPMLLAVVNKKNVDQQFIIHIALSIDILDHEAAVFTSASANTDQPPDFYSDSADLDKLRWDLIDSLSWKSGTDDERHARMAEALVHSRVDPKLIGYIVVWNDYFSDKVKKTFAKYNIPCPTVTSIRHKGRYHYYMKPPFPSVTSLVTGPIILKGEYKGAVEEVMEARNEESPDEARFESIEDAVDELDDDFCALPELAAINDLPTANQEHREDVGAHTRTVIDKLRNSDLYEELSAPERVLVEFAAYLHDIGKGNSPRDDQGRQRVDPDHPASAIPLVQRVLTEDIETIDEEEVRQVILLVAYHDLIGDIVGKGRNRQQLLDVIECAEDFDMLAALNCADVESLIPEGGLAKMMSSHPGWLERIKAGLPDLREWVLENLEDEE
jgi:ssDNA thymidine ADP-ribosyltransferase, DarT